MRKLTVTIAGTPLPMTTRTQVLALTAAMGLAAPAALATAPGHNGQIAFRRYLAPERTKGAIFLAAPDGSGQRQITSPPANTSDDYPDFAPDGSFVAFQRCGRRCHIYTVRTDGTGLRMIGSGSVDRSYPAISPDQTRIAFIRTFGHLRPNRPPDHVGIYSIRMDGSGERQVALPKSKIAEDIDPQWSPDGRRVLFVRVNGPRAKPRFGQAIFVVNADGTGLRRITPWRLRAGDGPDWSPNGKEILFRSPETEDFLHCNLFTIRPDGTGLRQVTHLAPGTKLYSASFSPDGQFITFGQTGVDGQADVWTMRSDGGGITPLTRSPQWDSAPDWGATA